MKRSEIKALFPDATKDQIDSIMDLHGEGLESIRANYKDYVPKSELDTITAELTALKTAPKQEPTAEQLAELETLRKFKTDTETKIALDNRNAGLRLELEKAKAHPDAVDLLLLKFNDIKDIEPIIGTDGKVTGIKDFDKIGEPVKAAHSKFFGVEQVIGAKPGVSTAQTITETDISKMSMEQYKEYRKQNNFSN